MTAQLCSGKAPVRGWFNLELFIARHSNWKMFHIQPDRLERVELQGGGGDVVP